MVQMNGKKCYKKLLFTWLIFGEKKRNSKFTLLFSRTYGYRFDSKFIRKMSTNNCRWWISLKIGTQFDELLNKIAFQNAPSSPYSPRDTRNFVFFHSEPKMDAMNEIELDGDDVVSFFFLLLCVALQLNCTVFQFDKYIWISVRSFGPFINTFDKFNL